MPEKRPYTREEVAQHATEDDCWVIVHKKVYDVTQYLEDHPGGVSLIVNQAGKDATADFEAVFHTHHARKKLEEFYLGDVLENAHAKRFLEGQAPASSQRAGNTRTAPSVGPSLQISMNTVPGSVGSLASRSQSAQSSLPRRRLGGAAQQQPVRLQRPGRKQQISTQIFLPFQLDSIKKLNSNTSVFKFKLSFPDATLQMPLGSHLQVQIEDKRQAKKGSGGCCSSSSVVEYITRKYTPIRTDEPGFFDLMVKYYENGPMSSHIFGLKPGQNLAFRGPMGTFDYERDVQSKFDHVIMVCCGTGIAPMYQILDGVLKNPTDKTKFTLLFANRTEDDILLKKELDSFAQSHPEQLTIYYLLSKPKDTSYPLQGHINEELFTKYLASTHDPKAFVCVCGTNGFSDTTSRIFNQLGFGKQIHIF